MMEVGNIVKLRNGTLCQVIYEAAFGKLLLVELTGKSEPPLAHWYNNDGTFMVDDKSPFDVVEFIPRTVQGVLPVINRKTKTKCL